MSASPAPPTAMPSQKRPLEDPSLESGPDDQPDAKRPALGTTRGESPAEETLNIKEESTSNGVDGMHDGITLEPVENTSAQLPADGSVANGSGGPTEMSASSILETQPIQSTTSVNESSTSQAGFASQHQDETGWLHMRAIISSAEAATIIGKGGENVTLIRRMSGAKCTVSDYSRGAVERILTVSGLVDAAAKVCPEVLSLPLAES